MAQYIDKAAVMAEIKRIMAEEMSFFKDCIEDKLENTSSPVVYTRMEMILSFLDTLEVKEVDEVKIGETQIYLEDDGGEQPYDGKQWLDLSCTEYEIPKALFKDGDNVEILIRKMQKGE